MTIFVSHSSIYVLQGSVQLRCAPLPGLGTMALVRIVPGRHTYNSSSTTVILMALYGNIHMYVWYDMFLRGPSSVQQSSATLSKCAVRVLFCVLCILTHLAIPSSCHAVYGRAAPGEILYGRPMMMLPLFNLRQSPGFQVNHIPNGELRTMYQLHGTWHDGFVTYPVKRL